MSAHIAKALLLVAADRPSWQPGPETELVWDRAFGTWSTERLLAAVERFLRTNERTPTIAAISKADEEVRESQWAAEGPETFDPLPDVLSLPGDPYASPMSAGPSSPPFGDRVYRDAAEAKSRGDWSEIAELKRRYRHEWFDPRESMKDNLASCIQWCNARGLSKPGDYIKGSFRGRL